MKFANIDQILKRRSFTSYKWLVFSLGFLLITGIWTFVYYQINWDYERTIEENSRETMNLAKAFEEHVRRIITGADKDLFNLKYAYEQKAAANAPVAPILANLSQDLSRTLIAIYNADGMVIQASAEDALDQDRSDRDYYRYHKDHQDQLYIGLPIVGRFNGITTIPLTRRINHPDGSFGGIVYIGLRKSYFMSFYEKIDLGQNQLLALTGTDGLNRARQTDARLELPEPITSNPAKLTPAADQSSITAASESPDGISRIISCRIMPDYPLVVTVGKSTQVALADFEQRKKFYITGAIAASLALLAFMLWLFQQFDKQQKLNIELLRLDRLNLVGEMAAGIGHEIRNPLTAVRGYLQWYLQKEKYAEFHTDFTTMIEELDRANAIITEYLSLAKDKSIDLKPGNLNQILDSLFPLLRAEAYNSGHDLILEKENLPQLPLNDSEIRQLVLNLVRNGFDAMEASGILTIRTHVDGDHVLLSVHDTGTGIPDTLLDKLGTPFLTTKDHGTGLGLAVCYQIAARHHAKIEVHSVPGNTTFYAIFNAINSSP